MGFLPVLETGFLLAGRSNLATGGASENIESGFSHCMDGDTEARRRERFGLHCLSLPYYWVRCEDQLSSSFFGDYR